MKQRGESALSIWQKILRQYHDSRWKSINHLHEDNTTCISCLRSGTNKTMKTLERGFGVDIAWNHDRIESGDYDLIHTRSSHMAADIFTKPFSGPAPWTRLRRCIATRPWLPKEFVAIVLQCCAWTFDKAYREGVSVNH